MSPVKYRTPSQIYKSTLQITAQYSFYHDDNNAAPNITNMTQISFNHIKIWLIVSII